VAGLKKKLPADFHIWTTPFLRTSHPFLLLL